MNDEIVMCNYEKVRFFIKITILKVKKNMLFFITFVKILTNSFPFF